MKSTTETSMFRKPMNVSKKRPEMMPAIGEYDQSIFTIEAAQQKKKERYACKLFVGSKSLK